MKTNDIKKGMVVELNNGWFGIMADNMRGNTRMVDVDGMYREMGSVYSHDIIRAWNTKLKMGSDIKKQLTYKQLYVDGIDIEHNKKQLELKSFIASNY
jgi:hypothetical protein